MGVFTSIKLHGKGKAGRGRLRLAIVLVCLLDTVLCEGKLNVEHVSVDSKAETHLFPCFHGVLRREGLGNWSLMVHGPSSTTNYLLKFEGRMEEDNPFWNEADDHDFMKAFLENENHDAFDDEYWDNMMQNANMEDHFSDFFQQAEHKMNDLVGDGAEYMKKYLGSDHPLFGEKDSDVLTEDFDDFPDEDVFADVQDSGDPECEEWKKKVSEAQARVREEGKLLQRAAKETEKEMDVYMADQKKECSIKCPTVCIPSDVGETCLEKKNGTCVAKEPKIDDCARRIRDPECEAKEAECEASKIVEAKKMTEKERLQEKAHKDLEKDEVEMVKVTEDIPEKCKAINL